MRFFSLIQTVYGNEMNRSVLVAFFCPNGVWLKWAKQCVGNREKDDSVPD